MYKISIIAAITFTFLTMLYYFSSLSSNTLTVNSVKFAPVSLSVNNTEKKMMRISKALTLTYNDGSVKEYPLTYKILAKMGDKIGSGIIGLITDKNSKPILEVDGSQDISNEPDGNSLITIGEKTFLITHMEEYPGVLYNTEVKVENEDLVAVNTKVVDLSALGGTIVTCASTKTLYGSHIGGEEDYSLNSIFSDIESPFYIDCALDGTDNDIDGEVNPFCSYVNAMGKYLGDTGINKKNAYNGNIFSPYNYGYIVEVQPQKDGSTKSAKHYVTGKYTPELAVMMPDSKTIYMSDDGTAKSFWKFVSDSKINKFNSDWEGTLYAAKVNQVSADNGGTFNLSWVELGHAKDSEVKSMIDSKMKLTNIFSIAKPNKNGNCESGYTSIYEDSTFECLKLVLGQEKAAAFLESRKYAAYKGASTEFRKEEGLTYDKDSNVLYVAMSSIDESMEDNYTGLEPANHIKLKRNICGAVYKVILDENYSATKMNAIVVGDPLSIGEKYSDEWRCSPNTIANPDNITYIGNNILLISEDTTNHVNNMTWAYNTKDKSITRIASLPIGAEVTGVDTGIVGSKAVLMINTQHPFKDNPEAADGSKPNTPLIENVTDEELRAEIGYIDGFPSILFK